MFFKRGTKGLPNKLFLIQKFFNSQMASRDPHGGAFEQVGCHHKRTKCYRNNYSKGGKGDGVLNEFVSKL